MYRSTGPTISRRSTLGLAGIAATTMLGMSLSADPAMAGQVTGGCGGPASTARTSGSSRDATWQLASSADVDPSGVLAGDAYLVKDIAPPGADSPSYLTDVGGMAFFFADDGVAGLELWTSDGTEDGTQRITDLGPGAANARVRAAGAVGDTYYFSANDGTHGWELWKSDGTATGTILVRDSVPGAGGSHPGQLTAVGDQLYFTASTPSTGFELWTSDGTRAGTRRVKDIKPGIKGSDPEDLTPAHGDLYFVARGRLWRSDGSAAGTAPVPLPDDVHGPYGLTRAGPKLYFGATQGLGCAVPPAMLWVTDGTPGGTRMVRPNRPIEQPEEMVAIGRTLYVTQEYQADRLYATDGTPNGTRLVRDFAAPGDLPSAPGSLTRVGGTLYFAVVTFDDEENVIGRALWMSDGTAAGTQRVKAHIFVEGLTDVAGTLYFVSDRDSTGWELWTTDGSSAGTRLVEDINGTGSSSPEGLVSVGDSLYFSADDGVHGRELWRVVP
jgi:ELWxxDGT repeat protein